jgi:hypothetical protein
MFRKLILTAILCSLPALAAEKYALLIGIGKYLPGQRFPDLQGPPNDVDAISKLLVADYGFQPANITSLLDAKASRAGILDALDQIVAKARPGDFVFIYYSGHGTSPQDPAWKQTLPIDADAGALVPADFRQGTPAEVSARLVVGRRDLRPRFEKLDGKVTVFGLLDTCFSQNLMKGLLPVYHGTPRSVTASQLTLRGGIDEDIAGDINDTNDIQNQTKPSPYPYHTIAWISAAQAGEQAVDLDGRVLKEHPDATFDGKPHGQFTNALVKGLRGEADLNHDGKISNSELYDYMVKTAEGGQWSHQPALSMNDEDKVFPASFALAGRTRALEAQYVHRDPGKVRVKLVEVPASVRSAVAALPGIEMNDQSPDVILRGVQDFHILEGDGTPISREAIDQDKVTARIAEQADRLHRAAKVQAKVRVKLQNVPASVRSEIAGLSGIETGDQSPDLILRGDAQVDFRLYEGSGAPISTDAVDADKAIARIKAEPDVTALRDLGYKSQKVNASMSLWKDGDRLHQGVFAAGNEFEIHMRADAPVWPLVVDIDNTGYVTVLYPRKEKKSVVKNDENLGLNGVKCPCGIEYLKTILFEKEPFGYQDWAGRDFEPSSADMKHLLDLAKTGVGETTLKVISNPLK